MLDTKPAATAAEATTADGRFDPYSRLLRMLMPSLHGMLLHDGFGNQIWASDDCELTDDADVVKEMCIRDRSAAARYRPGPDRRCPTKGGNR